jgi:ABC-type transport system involved in cytochrome c biogenesis ATPase subunit
MNRMRSGLLIMDEPESALSPQRQLALLTHLAQLIDGGGTQSIAAKTRVEIGAADIGTGTRTTPGVAATRTLREKDACALSGGR